LAASSVSLGSSISDVSQSVFTAADRNGDRQLSASEFTTFLNALIGNLSGRKTTGGLGSAATAIVKPAASPSTGYAEIPGFAFGKLINLSYVNDKYTPALRVFSRAIHAESLPPVSSSLASIVSYAQANGFPNAKAIGKDVIDFGDGHGEIDVITDVGGPHSTWWFHNQR
jgi:hypothetical protein